MDAEPIRITHITVKRDRLVLTVRVAPGAPRRTTPQLAAALTAAVPSLPRHACVNERGATLESVLACTSLPHVLEHLIIDAQARAAQPETPTFVGFTAWTDEAAGEAAIEVSYGDDLQALSAAKQALATLNGVLARAGY